MNLVFALTFSAATTVAIVSLAQLLLDLLGRDPTVRVLNGLESLKESLDQRERIALDVALRMVGRRRVLTVALLLCGIVAATGLIATVRW